MKPWGHPIQPVCCVERSTIPSSVAAEFLLRSLMVLGYKSMWILRQEFCKKQGGKIQAWVLFGFFLNFLSGLYNNHLKYY